MINLRRQWLEEIKDLIKKTIVEEDKRSNKVKIAPKKINENKKGCYWRGARGAFEQFIRKLLLLYSTSRKPG